VIIIPLIFGTGFAALKNSAALSSPLIFARFPLKLLRGNSFVKISTAVSESVRQSVLTTLRVSVYKQNDDK